MDVSNLTFSFHGDSGKEKKRRTYRNLKSGFWAVRLTFYRTLSTRPLVTLAQFEEAQNCLLHILLHCTLDGHIVTDNGNNMPEVRANDNSRKHRRKYYDSSSRVLYQYKRQPQLTIVSCELTLETMTVLSGRGTDTNLGRMKKLRCWTEDGADAGDDRYTSFQIYQRVLYCKSSKLHIGSLKTM